MTGVGHVDGHPADGIGRRGRRNGLVRTRPRRYPQPAGRADRDELGNDRDGDLPMVDRAQIETGRCMQPAQRGLVDSGCFQPLLHRSSATGRRDETDVAGVGGERRLHRHLVPSALSRHDDRRVRTGGEALVVDNARGPAKLVDDAGERRHQLRVADDHRVR